MKFENLIFDFSCELYLYVQYFVVLKKQILKKLSLAKSNSKIFLIKLPSDKI